jgi:diguanylate cyclase (GGDEF)-like protein/PAS domain S-box-containing protein
MLTAATVEGPADSGDVELSDEHIGDHDSMSWMQVQLDHLGVVLHVEGKSVEIAGRRPDEMIGEALTTFIHPDSAKDTIPMWFSLLGEGAGATRSSRRCYVHPDGTPVWVESAYLNRLEGDGRGHVLVFASDITERRAQEEALRLQTREVARLAFESRLLAEDFRLLADEVPAAVFRCDDEGRITFHNTRWTELLDGGDGVARLADIVAADQREALAGHLTAVLSDERSTPHSFELGAARDGRVYAFRCRSITDPEPARRRIVGSVEDATATVQLRLDASHDKLTGLLNRAAIDLALAAALREDSSNLVVLFVDLDRFKEVNDAHGHEAGDIVLREIAARLTSAVRPGDLVGRYGGDEFVVLCHSVEAARAAALPRRLALALAGPVRFPEGRWTASASVGAARPRAGEDLKSLMRRADQAMFEQKRERAAP